MTVRRMLPSQRRSSSRRRLSVDPGGSVVAVDGAGVGAGKVATRFSSTGLAAAEAGSGLHGEVWRRLVAWNWSTRPPGR